MEVGAYALKRYKRLNARIAIDRIRRVGGFTAAVDCAMVTLR